MLSPWNCHLTLPSPPMNPPPIVPPFGSAPLATLFLRATGPFFGPRNLSPSLEQCRRDRASKQLLNGSQLGKLQRAFPENLNLLMFVGFDGERERIVLRSASASYCVLVDDNRK